MPESTAGNAMNPGRPGLAPRRHLSPVRLLLGLGKRVYALLLIVVVLWLSWRAFKYLLVALIFSAPPPPQIVELPRRMDVSMLSPQAYSAAGIAATENPRTPPAHYHQLGAWFQSDAANDCTRSGCHQPLPHGKNKADRAFLNLHATSLHCGVCHMQTDQTPLDLTWYDLRSGTPAEVPALLRAYGWLMTPRALAATDLTPADQRTLVAFLRTAAQEAGREAVLAQLADHLAAVRVGSDEFLRLLETARKTVPQHFRGEYGAKLALVDAQSKQPRLKHPASEEAVRQYLAQAESLGPADRQAVLARVHPLRRQPTLTCTQCHSPQGGLVNLAAVGYPEARIQALLQPLVMQAIEHVVAGREFYMPGFMTPPGASQPSQQPE